MAELGRRDFLRRVGKPEPAPPARVRPPGAVAEREFLARCTGCNECVKACPHNVIHSLAPHVSPGAGTPVMVVASRPCHLCEGFPCAAACPEGALRVPEASEVHFGTVEIDVERCLPYRGPDCGACAGVCPPAAAGALQMMLGRPFVDPDRCNGCGLCISACIVRPAAIKPLAAARPR